jgi:ABC-type glycerol-3-phosphate transport system substrate-binding protein
MSNLPAAPLNEDPRANEWLARYLPQFLDIGRVGERIYAIPHAYGTPLLFCNLDLFREAGLDPEHLPQTWDEVVAAAQQITARTGRPSFVHLTASMRDYGTMLMVTNAGGSYLSRDGRRALFDSPQGIAALQLWQDLVVRYHVAPIMNDQQMTAAFQGGQIAMFINSSAALRPFAAAAEGHFALGVAQYPTFAGQPRRVPNSGAAIMMFAPAGPRREATLRLLEFLSRREIANRWARETGYMPLSVDPLADPAMARYVESFPLVRPAIAQMAETIDTARWPARGAIEAQTEVSNLIDALWAGRGPASALVPPAVARINDTLQRFNP